MNSIKKIGFTNTIVATDPYDPFIESEWTIAVVFELSDWYRM